ncbi:cytochrome c oxidase subunit 7C, mitochondrial [Microplitis demolitor]|uniref:cytochrome c oxidase subunit 7C, mitochondrial n=1 Tax=Microplitis demolitor TaxID=69319 RepID=UPI0006D50B7C|nr:cytochrome c oxidase subunit 7C, mitochondrial [Microplitis demolitor]XP_014295167.1 cytochrome c oxidase subunit 7C, mitochondrial [Microplitis demolitor]
MFARQMLRRFTTSAVRRSEHESGGIPGANLPFDIKNKYKLTAYFIMFFGSALALPWIIVRHQMLK